MTTTDRRPRHDDEPPMRSGSIDGGRRAQRWASTYAAYRRWVDERGSHPRQRGSDPTESMLGEWARNQRKAHLAGTMPPDRVAALESVPGWVWNRHQADWETTFAAYCSWVADHDGDHPRVEGGRAAETRLGLWAVRQRRDRRNGVIDEGRIAELDGLVGWQWDPCDHAWHEVLARYCAFVDEHRRNPLVRATDPDERSLAEWAKGQRRAHRKGTLRDDWVAALDAVDGWLWDIPRPWER